MKLPYYFVRLVADSSIVTIRRTQQEADDYVAGQGTPEDYSVEERLFCDREILDEYLDKE